MYICALQALPYGPSVVAAPITYVIYYFGENITNGSDTVTDASMTVFNLSEAYSNKDSDVNVVVTAMNAFGSGPPSNVSVDEIGGLHTYICCIVGRNEYHYGSIIFNRILQMAVLN